jgi:hypothetical protein
MTNLTKPDFKLSKPNPYANTTDAEWWLWLHLDALHPAGLLGGILANKSGYHGTGQYNLNNFPGNYSIKDAVDRSGPWWKGYASALDWTFPDAQRGDYRSIDKFTSRLVASALDSKDPRLDMILREFYGQADSDRAVEGYDERREAHVTSDSSHLWHIHFSFTRSKCGDFWAMWALLTVLMGWSVAKWRASLPAAPPAPPKPPTPPAAVPTVKPGSRVLELKFPNLRGSDVAYVQKWIGAQRAGAADGIFGPKTRDGVRWYQGMRGIKVDGIVGPVTWRHMGVK